MGERVGRLRETDNHAISGFTDYANSIIFALFVVLLYYINVVYFFRARTLTLTRTASTAEFSYTVSKKW